VFERFTPRARHVVVLAEEEARLLRHNYIGTEHLLLGLLREEEGIAARVLEGHRVALAEARRWVTRVVGKGDEALDGQLPFTPRMQKILELAMREALTLGHNYIGTEHLLLALIREGEGAALHAMRDLGASPEEVWESVHRKLGAETLPPLEPVREAADSTRRAVLLQAWAALVAGGAIFAAGLFVGWLIWG
jgi:ATP-dependent Clp protease ATP-binding subunit ClpC